MIGQKTAVKAGRDRRSRPRDMANFDEFQEAGLVPATPNRRPRLVNGPIAKDRAATEMGVHVPADVGHSVGVLQSPLRRS